MSKLQKLKKWLTVQEAAQQLAGVFNESVTVADIYRFYQAGYLGLSVNFVNAARATTGHAQRIREAGFEVQTEESGKGGLQLEFDESVFPEYEAWRLANPLRASEVDQVQHGSVVPAGVVLTPHHCVRFEERPRLISGVWDVFSDNSYVAGLLQREVSAPLKNPLGVGPLILRDDSSPSFFAMLAPTEMPGSSNSRRSEVDPFFGVLPPDAHIVVRPKEIVSLIEHVVANENSAEPLSAANEPKKESTREINNLLRVIGGLAKAAGVSTAEGGGGATAIAKAVQLAGYDGPGERTVEKFLKHLRILG